jgi:hypothetical protein
MLSVVSGGCGVDFAGDIPAFANLEVTIRDLAGHIAAGFNQQGLIGSTRVHELAGDPNMVGGTVASDYAICGDIDGPRIDNAINRAIHFDQSWRTERANGDHARTNKKIAFDVFTHEIPQEV